MDAPPKTLTLEAAREALELHVRTKTWLRRDLAKTLPIESFERSGSFHVRFRSFTEERAHEPVFEPFRGGRVDGPENGRPPTPWEMQVKVPGLFINQEYYQSVPHTEHVRTCHGCNGDGDIVCPRCSGHRRVTCSRCNGSGKVTETRQVTRTNAQGQSEHFTETYTTSCGPCGGDGKVTCPECHGNGRITCPTCQGARQLKHGQRLHVTWKTHVSDKILEKTDLPDDLIGGAMGEIIHSEEDDRLEPIASAATSGGPYRGAGGRVNGEVNELCNQLLQAHRFSGDTKLWRQSIHVKAVPVYEARYSWGKETRRFWVFGNEEQVYAPHYPLSIQRVGLAIGIPLAILASTGAYVYSQSSPDPPPYTAPSPATPERGR